MALTDIQIKRSKPGDQNYKITDGRGLYLLITAGGGKLWRWDYRFEGKRKTMALGKYPDVSLADARAKVCRVELFEIMTASCEGF